MIALTSDLLTRVEEIDGQHKELFNQINKLESMTETDSSEEQVKKTMDFLGKYVEKHFSDEEALQLKYKYPKYNWHREMHNWYITEFRKMENEYNKNGASEDFTKLLHISISNWIVKHIATVDVNLGKFINEQKRKK